MPLLNILTFPNNALRQKAKSVDVIDDAVGSLVNDMQSTMYASKGIGLAATQVGVMKRVIAVDLSAGQESGGFVALINPVIISVWGETEEAEEGCLSIPGIREEVRRKTHIKLKAFDRDGVEIKMEAGGMLARAIQHEMDHLDGRLFVDKLSFFKRLLLRKKLKGLSGKV